MTFRLLLVDDDDTFRERMARALNSQGISTEQAANGADAISLHALRKDEHESFTHALVDLRMPGLGGLDVVSALHDAAPQMHISVLTGFGSIDTALEAVRRGATHYLQKPTTARAVMAQLFGSGEQEPLEATAPADDVDNDEVPSLARNEWEYIQRILRECDNNVSLAARRLGLHRRTLQRKLNKLPPLK